MQKSVVYAKHNSARISAKKVRPVMDLVRGEPLDQARRVLEFHPTKASDMLLKVLDSAAANARNNLGLNERDLFVSEIYANEGSPRKSGRWVAKSRFNPILKRTAHIVIGLSERSK